MACSSFAATPAKPRKHHHSQPAASLATNTGQSRTAAKGTSAKASKTASRRKGKTARTPSRSYQQAPTADRYREIQQALASKGYFKGETNGNWGADSADALKRFQADQNLMPDGKIGSLSLIALGLGPKRLSAKSESVPAASVAPQTAPASTPPSLLPEVPSTPASLPPQ